MRHSLLAVILALVPVCALYAQADTTLGMTLRTWEDLLWLRIADREGASGGRTSSDGILQRFPRFLDSENELDLVHARFTFAEDYAWHRRTQGFRWWAGSVNKNTLATFAQFKTEVPFAGAWTARLRADFERTLEADRGLLTIALGRSWTSGFYAYAQSTLVMYKPGSDFALGAGWTAGDTDLRVSVNVLDYPNNLIHLTLNAADDPPIDTTFQYIRQPLSVRASARVPLAGRVKGEAFVAVTNDALVHVYDGLAEDSGYAQAEQVGYVGGLVEWAFAPSWRGGAFGTLVRARTDRSALAPGLPVDEFELVERGVDVGGFVMGRLGSPTYVEGFLARQWRPERRTVRAGTLSPRDYEDRSWVGQAMMLHRFRSGLLADLGFLMDLRETVRGLGQIEAGPFDAHNFRLRVGTGWDFGDAFGFLIGIGLDLDGRQGKLFDGARGRFHLNW